MRRISKWLIAKGLNYSTCIHESSNVIRVLMTSECKAPAPSQTGMRVDNQWCIMRMGDVIRVTLSMIKIKCHFLFPSKSSFLWPILRFSDYMPDEKSIKLEGKNIDDPMGSELTLKRIQILKRLHIKPWKYVILMQRLRLGCDTSRYDKIQRYTNDIYTTVASTLIDK